LKTPEEFAEAMKGKETFALKRAPDGLFTVSTTKKKALQSIWWPEITNAEEADRASKMGSGSAVFIAIVNAIVATASVIINAPVLGTSADGYLNAALFALVAWGIRCRSSYASMAGLVIFILEKAYQVSANPRLIGGLAVMVFLSCGFISGFRGTRAYRRFEPEKAFEQAKPFIAVWRTPSIWVTLVLGTLVSLACGLDWLRILEALMHRSAGSPPVMTGNPLLYAVSIVTLVSAAVSVFAIIRRPPWGRALCALFSLSFTVLCLWCLALRGPSGEGAKVAVWTVFMGLLTAYVYATCFGKGARNYFTSFTNDPEVFRDRWPQDQSL
jgi:hypothetical protein